MNYLTESGLLKGLARLGSLLGDDDMDKGQITTGPGSSQGNMKDMHQETYGDSWSDGISGDGTDFKGRGGKASKARGRGDTYDEEGQEESEDEDEDEDEDDDDKKSLPTSGKPLRTSAPNANRTIEPGAPGMTKSNPVDVPRESTVTPSGEAQPDPPSARSGPEFQNRVNTRAERRAQMMGGSAGRRAGATAEANKSNPLGVEERGETGLPGGRGSTAIPPKPPLPSGERSPVKDRALRQQQGQGIQLDRSVNKAHGEGCECKNCMSKTMYGSPSVRRSIEIEEDGEVQKGIEVSEFLFYLNKSFNDSIYDMSQRVNRRIDLHHSSRGEFATGLAEAVVGINKSLSSHEVDLNDEETAPAYAAKSVQGSGTDEQRLQKSLHQGMNLRKSILDQLGDELQKGNGTVSALDIIRVETASGLSGLTPELQNIPAIRQILQTS